MLTAPETDKQNQTQAVFAKRLPSPSPVLGEKTTLRINPSVITARPVKSSYFSADPERQTHLHPSRTRWEITSSVKTSLTSQADLVTYILKAHCHLFRILLANLPLENSNLRILYFTALLDHEICREEACIFFCLYICWMNERMNECHRLGFQSILKSKDCTLCSNCWSLYWWWGH